MATGLKRAFSVAETILAVSLLMLSVLGSSLFLAQSSNANQVAQQSRQALGLANQRLETVRAWARLPANFDSNWSAVEGQRDEPGGFSTQFSLTATFQGLFSPSQAMEEAFLAPRRLRNSVKMGVVTCRAASRQRVEVRLPAYFSSPYRTPRSLLPVSVSRVGGAADPVPPAGTVEWEAILHEPGGQAIEDVVFTWEVIALGGNATVEPTDRMGSRATLTHSVRRGSRQLHVSGTVLVRARVRYWGRVYAGDSAEVNLR